MPRGFYPIHNMYGAVFYNFGTARQPNALFYLLGRQKVFFGLGQRSEGVLFSGHYPALAADSRAAAVPSDPNACRRRGVRREFAAVRLGPYIVWHKGYCDLFVYLTHYDHPFANRSASSLMAPFL